MGIESHISDADVKIIEQLAVSIRDVRNRVEERLERNDDEAEIVEDLVNEGHNEERIREFVRKIRNDEEINETRPFVLNKSPNELRKLTDLSREYVSRSLNKMFEEGLLEREKDPKDGRQYRYTLSPDYRYLAGNISRRSTESTLLNGYKADEMVGGSGFSVYGLSRDFWINNRPRIKTKDALGDFYNVPRVKIRAELQKKQRKGGLEEEEIIDRIAEYYVEKIEDGADVESVIRRIIRKDRNKTLKFKDIGSNIIEKLDELKENEKHLNLENTYDRKLKNEDISEDVEEVLENFKEELIGICKQVPGSLDIAIFVNYGKGCGAFPGRIPFPEDKEERFKEFRESISALYADDVELDDILPISFSESIDEKYLSGEQEELLDFLRETISENADYYNQIMVTARSGNSFRPELPITEERLARES